MTHHVSFVDWQAIPISPPNPPIQTTKRGSVFCWGLRVSFFVSPFSPPLVSVFPFCLFLAHQPPPPPPTLGFRAAAPRSVYFLAMPLAMSAALLLLQLPHGRGAESREPRAAPREPRAEAAETSRAVLLFFSGGGGGRRGGGAPVFCFVFVFLFKR